MTMRSPKMRTLVRWLHLVLAIPIMGYIYSPFAVLPNYAPITRLVFFPVMVLSGLWMWKGHWLRALRGRAETEHGKVTFAAD